MTVEIIVFWMVVAGGAVGATLRIVQIYGDDVIGFVRWYRRFKQEIRVDKNQDH